MWAAAAGCTSELPAKDWTKGNERTGVISLADLPPEVRLKLEEHARQHWVTWFDVPVPALNHLTPREAAKIEEGRELLESLLLGYERHDDDSNENLMRPDVPELRRKLGMHV